MTALFCTNGHVVADHGAGGDVVLTRAAIRLDGANIAAIDAAADPQPGEEVIDLAGGWLLPGFVDTQVNGGGGVLFNDAPDVDGIAAIGAAHARFGTTGFLPTLISDTPERIAIALSAVDAAIAAGVPGVLGIHVEGPFINRARNGIHPADRIRPLEPAMLDLLCAPRRGIVLLTVAPECVAPADLMRLAAAGVVLSAGHSDATYEQAMTGFTAGISGVTHLFNAMSPLTHRAPGLVGAAFDSDAVCGIIADGLHVSAPALRLAMKAIGPDRLMLVTDAMPGVGHAGDSFTLNGRTIRIVDGRCVDEHGTLAGAHLDMARALRTMADLTGADISSLSRMASGTPAHFIGLGARLGRLAPGMQADFAMLDARLQPVQTWIAGQRRA
ncbi:N-acetylglucosamine-6-phosphate deacetylase [Croceibacterium sp. TMG7-5b_MA50]|uniref:N-acetylglucosamine-6-phosphate deacetylase n=1 Tax=Croceibacterium sp. TMG7-5b_MA50 TaxID=3121290 RepID=UPI0032213B31